MLILLIERNVDYRPILMLFLFKILKVFPGLLVLIYVLIIYMFDDIVSSSHPTVVDGSDHVLSLTLP